MKNTIEINLSGELLETFTEALKQAVKEELPKYRDSFRKDWLSTEEVMEMLSVSRGTIKNYRKDRKISHTQLAEGGKILYPRKQIESLLTEHLVKASDPETSDEEPKELNPFFKNLPHESFQ